MAFFDKEGKKVFLSTEEDEYPGDSFAELTLTEPSDEPVAATDDTEDAADQETENTEEKPEENADNGADKGSGVN